MNDNIIKLTNAFTERLKENTIVKDKLKEENANLNRENDRLNDELENLKEAYGGETAKLKAELSLAELADKKGFTAIDIIIRNKDTNYSIYFYKLNKNNPIQGFDGRTYAEAEQKCFEHLRRIK